MKWLLLLGLVQGATLPQALAPAEPGPAPATRPEAAPFALSRRSASTLDNGLHLIVLEDRRKPIVTFRLLIPGAGGYYDPDDLPGVATVTAALLSEGTTTRTAAEIAARLDEIGATLTMAAEPSSTDFVMTGTVAKEHASKLMDLAVDIVLHPAFSEESVERYKQDAPMTLMLERDDPAFTAREVFAKAVYDSHPGSRIAPDAAEIGGITRDRIVDFHRAHYAPDHAVLAVDGDVSPFAARFYLGQKLGEWKRTGVEAPEVADPAAPEQSRILLVGRPGSAPTALVIGTQAVSRTSDDYDALMVLSEIAGGTLVAPAYTGVWHLEARTSPELTEAALQELLQKIRALREDRVADEALGSAKRSIVEAFELTLGLPEALAGYLAAERRYGLPAGYWDSYPSRIDEITAEQVQAAARKYLAPNRLQIVVAGSEPAQRD